MQSYAVELDTDAGYLSLLTRKIFHSGFTKTVIDRRWAAFEHAFLAFDPPSVAAMTDADIDRLAQDPAIIRNRRKIAAVVANARHFSAVAADHGSWAAWLAKLRDCTDEERQDTLLSCLTQVGPNTLFYFLLEAGEVDEADKPEGVK